MLFMQNKPNFRKSQMNVSIFSQMAYEYKHNWILSKNKPNQTQSRNNSRAPMIAIGFDYNGIFVTRLSGLKFKIS